MAVGEYNGLINLYKYPAVCQFNQAHKEYRAHANAITRVKFSCDDKKLISTSGMDRGVFVWKIEKQLEDDDYSRGEVDPDDINIFGIVVEK